MKATDAIKNPLIRYYGGKWLLANWIISHFPPHDSYVEPCGGGASVLLQKPICDLETYNDLDKNVVNFFTVLRNNGGELKRRLQLTPYAREENTICKESCLDDPIESARRFVFSSVSSINNMTHGKSSGFRTESYSGQSYKKIVKVFRCSLNSLDAIVERLKYVQIENKSAEYIIERYASKEGNLIYFDPPYVKSTRSSKNVYHFEVTDQFHIDTAELLKKTKSYVVISGYNCPLYEELYEGWYRVDRESQTNSGGVRTESLWLSDNIVKQLDISKPKTLF